MAKQSSPGTRLSRDQLMAKRWASQSEAETWLKANKYDLASLGCIIGMAPDQGVSLQTSDVLSRPVNGGSGSSYLDASYSTTLRGDLARNNNGDCFLRLPGPFSSEAMKYYARFHADVLKCPIEVVALNGTVLYQFDGSPEAATTVRPRKAAPIASGAAPVPSQEAPVAAQPATAEDTPPQDAPPASRPPAGRQPRKTASPEPAPVKVPRKTAPAEPEAGLAAPKPTGRIVTNTQMMELGRRDQGVSNNELTALNGGGNQPWKSWLSQVAKKHGLLVTTSREGKETVHRLW